MSEMKDYNIPLASIGYYGSGICDVDPAAEQELKNRLQPIEKYVNILVGSEPTHLTCRYLGYYDEVGLEQITAIRATIKSIYGKYLPLICESGGLIGSWAKRPNRKRKLLMLTVSGGQIKQLHQELLSVTAPFPIFRDVEADNFNPHITLAEIKGSFAEKIPVEVADFIDNFKGGLAISFNRAYLWTESGVEKI